DLLPNETFHATSTLNKQKRWSAPQRRSACRIQERDQTPHMSVGDQDWLFSRVSDHLFRIRPFSSHGLPAQQYPPPHHHKRRPASDRDLSTEHCFHEARFRTEQMWEACCRCPLSEFRSDASGSEPEPAS